MDGRLRIYGEGIAFRHRDSLGGIEHATVRKDEFHVAFGHETLRRIHRAVDHVPAACPFAIIGDYLAGFRADLLRAGSIQIGHVLSGYASGCVFHGRRRGEDLLFIGFACRILLWRDDIWRGDIITRAWPGIGIAFGRDGLCGTIGRCICPLGSSRWEGVGALGIRGHDRGGTKRKHEREGKRYQGEFSHR